MFPTFENGCQPGLPLNSMIGPGTVPTGFPGQASLHLPIGRHPLQLLLPCQGNHFLGELAIVDRNLISEVRKQNYTAPPVPGPRAGAWGSREGDSPPEGGAGAEGGGWGGDA